MSSLATLQMKGPDKKDAHFLQLRHILMKCKTDNLLSLVQEWQILPSNYIDKLKLIPKKNLKELAVTGIVHFCQTIQCSEEDVGLLDLLYHQKYGSGEWSIYKMYGRIGTVKQLSGDTLQHVIKKALKPYNPMIVVNLYKDALWSRIMTSTYSSRHNAYQSSVSFFVYYPSLPFIFVKRMKEPLISILIEELLLLFHYSNSSKMRFSGKHIGSLATLALNHMTRTKSTLLLDGNKKRKVEEPWVDNPRIQFENKKEKKRREEAISEHFGNGEVPVLQRLEYVLTYPESDKFQGFNCKVKFVGSHVIDGLRNLVKSNKIEQPMPSYLSDVLILGRNRFVLKNQ